MAGEVQVIIPSKPTTAYFVVRNAVGQYWYTVTPAFEAYNAAHWTSYAIAMTEDGTSQGYTGTFPTGISTGVYQTIGYAQVGGSAAITDTLTGVNPAFQWSGAVSVSLDSRTKPADTQARVTLVDTLTTYTSNTPQTGDNYPRLGAPAGASVSADILQIKNLTTNIKNNTFISHDIPQVLEKPDSGSETQPFHILFTDDTGAAADVDASGIPVVTLVQKDGTNVAARLSTWTRTSTGLYTSNYTNAAANSVERLIGYITATVNSVARAMPFEIQIVDTTAVSFTSTDRTTIQDILAKTDVATSTRMATFSYTAPDNTNIAVAATQSTNAAASAASADTKAGTLISRLGAFTGTGVNTVLGFMKAMFQKSASTPSDMGGTATAANDSLEAIRERGDAAWVTGSSGGGAGVYAVTLTVTDGTNPIQNATLAMIVNSSKYQGTTDVNGQVVLSPDEGAATYQILIIAGGYHFTQTLLVVAGAMSHTYAMTQITITPSLPTLLTGTLVALVNGTPTEGMRHVRRLIQSPASGVGYSFDKLETTVFSDSFGVVQFTNNFPGVRYEISREDGTVVSYLTPLTGTSFSIVDCISGF